MSRKAGKPRYRLLRDQLVETVPVYATGINLDEPEHFAMARQTKGHRAFKRKTDFGHDLDARNLREMRKTLNPEAVITRDANQSHTLSSARAFCDAIEDLKLS